MYISMTSVLLLSDLNKNQYVYKKFTEKAPNVKFPKNSSSGNLHNYSYDPLY
jgi:hypothetical protein